MALTKLEQRAIEWGERHQDEVFDAAQTSMFGSEKVGFCVLCGAEVVVYEGDASGDPCESCGESGVFAAEELMFYIGS